jgi:hypothetical protein
MNLHVKELVNYRLGQTFAPVSNKMLRFGSRKTLKRASRYIYNTSVFVYIRKFDSNFQGYRICASLLLICYLTPDLLGRLAHALVLRFFLSVRATGEPITIQDTTTI